MVRALSAALLLLAACPEPDDNNQVLTSQISALRVPLRQLEIAAGQYDRAMEKATESTCIGVHRTYDLQMLMIVMNADMGTEVLDTVITDHGGPADIACTVDAIETERSYHGAVACQELALADNQAEAGRHLVALGTLTTHLDARLAEIEAGDPENDVWTWSLPARCP